MKKTLLYLILGVSILTFESNKHLASLKAPLLCMIILATRSEKRKQKSYFTQFIKSLPISFR